MSASLSNPRSKRGARYDVWARLRDGSSVCIAPNCSTSDLMMHIREFTGDVESFTLIIIHPKAR